LIFLFAEKTLERNFLKQVLPQTMNVIYAGAYTPELFKGYETAYKKRVLPPKEQQRKAQWRGSSSGSFALKIGDTVHEARKQRFPLHFLYNGAAGTSICACLAVGPHGG
jgi:hypothetical protein